MRRNSLRLQHYDYSAGGAYFVTIVTEKRSALFGRVHEGIVQRNDLAEIVRRHWLHLPGHYPSVELDAYVTMPDHFHGILLLHEPTELVVEPRRTTLSDVVRSLKTFSAREINRTRGRQGAVWQRGFFDRVIRSDKELSAVRDYIRNNPLKLSLQRGGLPFD